MRSDLASLHSLSSFTRRTPRMEWWPEDSVELLLRLKFHWETNLWLLEDPSWRQILSQPQSRCDEVSHGQMDPRRP